MTRGSFRQTFAWLALLGLALHGAAAFGHAHGPELERHDCAICHVQSLTAEGCASATLGVSVPAATGVVVQVTARPIAGELLRAHPSRGPPA